MVGTIEHSRPHDRHSRLRPFAAWMKRLTALKPSQDATTAGNSRKRHEIASSSKTKTGRPLNNPYPLSGTVNPNGPSYRSRASSTIASTRGDSISYYDEVNHSSRQSVDSTNMPNAPKSAAPTISTHAGTVISEYPESSKAYSTGGMTTGTAAGALSSIGGGGGGGSTFSSPAPSVRSLTTTLTTIQSTAPSALIHAQDQNTNVQTGPTPPSAIPNHMMPGHPVTYAAATANNLLTDNASILTLASSTRRRRRRSMDTDASVRALAPSSLWGGSRESLPLSILSGNVGDSSSIIGASSSATPLPTRGSIAGAAAERASVYSVPGVINDRGSYHAVRPGGDGVSIKSGIIGHGRSDSAGGIHTSNARGGRRGSDWAEVEEAHDEEASGLLEKSVATIEKGKGPAA